jgi:Ca2+-binding EF-hand superfamily protein
MREFTSNQRALFEAFDTTKDGRLTDVEILKFMTDNLIPNANIDDVRDIIAEFDSTQDGTLNFDEFLNIFLPAADYNQRNLEYIQDPRLNPFNMGGMPTSVAAMAARILDRERLFMSRRRDARAALMGVPDTDINRIFSDLAAGAPEISMKSLIMFLESNGFAPRTEDLEAILRRCDHDADRCISLEEFAEAAGRNYQALLAERDAYFESIKLEREAKIAQHQAEVELRRKEWETKLEMERMDRDKRLDEIKIQEEIARKDREAQMEKYRIEREAQIAQWHTQ